MSVRDIRVFFFLTSSPSTQCHPVSTSCYRTASSHTNQAFCLRKPGGGTRKIFASSFEEAWVPLVIGMCPQEHRLPRGLAALDGERAQPSPSWSQAELMSTLVHFLKKISMTVPNILPVNEDRLSSPGSNFWTTPPSGTQLSNGN